MRGDRYPAHSDVSTHCCRASSRPRRRQPRPAPRAQQARRDPRPSHRPARWTTFDTSADRVAGQVHPRYVYLQHLHLRQRPFPQNSSHPGRPAAPCRDGRHLPELQSMGSKLARPQTLRSQEADLQPTSAPMKSAGTSVPPQAITHPAVAKRHGHLNLDLVRPDPPFGRPKSPAGQANQSQPKAVRFSNPGQPHLDAHTNPAMLKHVT